MDFSMIYPKVVIERQHYQEHVHLHLLYLFLSKMHYTSFPSLRIHCSCCQLHICVTVYLKNEVWDTAEAMVDHLQQKKSERKTFYNCYCEVNLLSAAAVPAVVAVVNRHCIKNFQCLINLLCIFNLTFNAHSFTECYITAYAIL